MTKNVVRLTLIAPLMLLLIAAGAQAQTTFSAGLKAPTKVILTARGNLLVAETGTGMNDGRVSLIDNNGARRTLIDGLPSAISPEGPSGPSGLAIRKKTLYVLIGAGDGVVAGPVQGSEAPNPSPTSPLNSSLLSFKFGPQIDDSAGGFVLTLNDQKIINSETRAKLFNSGGEKLTGELLIDFRNFVFEARPDFLDNVRASNPFALAIVKNKLYVVDSSLNLLREVDADTGDSRVLARFSPVRNPLPFGPPFSDYVPDNVKALGSELFVTNLVGFPFPAGASEVRGVNQDNGAQVTVITGLTSAIDVIPIAGAGGQIQYYTLEFSTNFLANAPGQIRFFSSASAAGVVVAGGLISPTSMARDAATGAIYITEIFTGRVIKVQP